jgi:MYXO-CTERM domain-containing protein
MRTPRFVAVIAPALLAGLAALVCLSVSPPAGAQDNGGLSQLVPGLTIVGASVSGNGPEAGHTLDSGQATAFVQSWLPNAVFGTPTFESPPASLPVYEIEVDYDNQGTVGFFIVKYASDGTNAWVALPAQQLFAGVVVTPDQADKWLLAPDRTVAAYRGEVAPETVPSVEPETTTPEPVSSGSSSGSSSVPLIVAVVVGGAAVVGLVLLGLGRRRREADAADQADDGRR